MNSLKADEFFRIFKVNLENECPFWEAEGNCITNKCSVGECERDEVPEQFLLCNQTFDVERDLQKTEVSMIGSFSKPSVNGSPNLGANLFIPKVKVNEWMNIEETDDQAIFVNLNKNSESMTYFDGSHIWDAIYKENCLSMVQKHFCSENQVLYKLISGVHANVNMHISRYDYDLNGDPLESNYERYLERVGSHPDRLNNMFFTYSFVLKAINKLSGKIDGFSYLSDNPQVDDSIKVQFNDLIDKSIKT